MLAVADATGSDAPEVVILHVRKDEGFAQALANHAEGLRRSGQLRLLRWSEDAHDGPAEVHIQDRLNRAALVLVILSSSFLRSPTMRLVEQALQLGVRIVPVLARICAWRRTGLKILAPLPRDGAIAQYSHPDEAYKDVIDALKKLLAAMSEPMPSTRQVAKTARTLVQTGSFTIEEVIADHDCPDIGYVQLAEFADIRGALASPNAGLVVEGATASGKTTTVKRALECLNHTAVQLFPKDQQLESFQRPEDIDGWVVIDNYHDIAEDGKRRIADLLQLMVDRPERAVGKKLILVGAGEIARSLVALKPQLIWRFDHITMRRQPDAIIDELLVNWEAALNVSFEPRYVLELLSHGSVALARQLALRAIRAARIDRTQRTTVRVAVSGATLVDALLGELRFTYDELYTLVREDRALPPPSGLYLALLWLLSSRGDRKLPLSELTTRYPHFSRMAEEVGYEQLFAPIRKSAALSASLLMDREGVTVADPRLSFYLRHANFTGLIGAAGLTGVAQIKVLPGS